MNCLLILNTQSGNYNKLSLPNILTRHTHPDDSITVKKLTNCNSMYSCVGYDKIIVCGGDGTLHHALNACHNTAVRHLVYVGCGTFNESCQSQCLRRQIGDISGRQFSYVLACGTLTSIGYTTPDRHKRKIKILAYIGKILLSYKVHNIPISIYTDKLQLQCNASVVMFLHSHRCFGLPFNRIYDKRDNKLYMLVIPSTGKDNLVNRVKLLLPMIRIFLLGTDRPIHSRHIHFDSVDNADITLSQDTAWCVDGEQIQLSGTHHVSTQHPTYKLTLDKQL